MTKAKTNEQMERELHNKRALLQAQLDKLVEKSKMIAQAKALKTLERLNKIDFDCLSQAKEKDAENYTKGETSFFKFDEVKLLLALNINQGKYQITEKIPYNVNINGFIALLQVIQNMQEHGKHIAISLNEISIVFQDDVLTNGDRYHISREYPEILGNLPQLATTAKDFSWIEQRESETWETPENSEYIKENII